MYQIFLSGGWLMWPILFCSIVALAISIERFIALVPNRIVPTGQLASVWTQLRSGELHGEALKALRDSSPLGYILAAGVNNSAYGRDVMKDSIEEAAGQVIHSLERFLAVLGTIANIAPLLGLLGTVLGMIQVFADIMLLGTGNASQLAGGISGHCTGYDPGLCRYYAAGHRQCLPIGWGYFSGSGNHSSRFDCRHSGDGLPSLF